MLHVIIRSRALDFSSRPPFLRSTPRRPRIAFLRPCVRRPAAAGPVRRRRVVPAARADYQREVVESYPASGRMVVLLSLPRNPCSARRSVVALLSLGPWARPDPRQLYKTPLGKVEPGQGGIPPQRRLCFCVGGKVVWCGRGPAYRPALHVAAFSISHSCARVPRPSAAPGRPVIHPLGCLALVRGGWAPTSFYK